MKRHAVPRVHSLLSQEKLGFDEVLGFPGKRGQEHRQQHQTVKRAVDDDQHHQHGERGHDVTVQSGQERHAKHGRRGRLQHRNADGAQAGHHGVLVARGGQVVVGDVSREVHGKPHADGQADHGDHVQVDAEVRHRSANAEFDGEDDQGHPEGGGDAVPLGQQGKGDQEHHQRAEADDLDGRRPHLEKLVPVRVVGMEHGHVEVGGRVGSNLPELGDHDHLFGRTLNGTALKEESRSDNLGFVGVEHQIILQRDAFPLRPDDVHDFGDKLLLRVQRHVARQLFLQVQGPVKHVQPILDKTVSVVDVAAIHEGLERLFNVLHHPRVGVV